MLLNGSPDNWQKDLAMGSKFGQIALRAGVAIALIALLVQISGVELARFRDVSGHLIAVTIGLSVLTLMLRALNFRLIAGSAARSELMGWMSLTANHQVLFSAIPSGLGDLSFPHLARAKTGLPLVHGARLIAVSRARDALTLLALAIIGLVVEGRSPIWLFAFSGLCLTSSYHLETFAHRLRHLLPQAGPVAQKLSALTQGSTVHLTARDRLLRVGGNLAIWLSATAAVGTAFASAGAALSPGDVLVLIAGLNVVGLFAVSIAGIGIAEAGAAGILIWLGWTTEPAIATALIGRPILLISVMAASGLIALSAWALSYKWRGAATAQLASSTQET